MFFFLLCHNLFRFWVLSCWLCWETIFQDRRLGENADKLSYVPPSLAGVRGVPHIQLKIKIHPFSSILFLEIRFCKMHAPKSYFRPSVATGVIGPTQYLR